MHPKYRFRKNASCFFFCIHFVMTHFCAKHPFKCAIVIILFKQFDSYVINCLTSIFLLADLYAFLVVFVLPLNSAVNPILYTFTTTKYRNQFISKSWYRLTGSKSTQDGSGRTVSCSNQCM